MSQGKVYLVGVGPGCEGLITARGLELLKKAQCVIHDRLVNPRLLELVPAGAEVINVGKRAGAHGLSQARINQLLLVKALEGREIVRLKGGDPCIFGRGAEEAATLAEAGIDFEIVPGVTAGIAAGEYAGIMLTHRDYASEVLFVTGHEADEKEASGIEWDILGRFGGTIVFYMGMGNIEIIVEQMIKNGKSSQTPAAVISDASMPTQRVVTASLGKIAEEARKAGLEPPGVIIVGQAAKRNGRLNWFMNKPLFGCRIVMTRDSRGNYELASRILRRGGQPIAFPAISIKALTSSNEFLNALSRLGEYDWIIFTSANGVSLFLEALERLGKDGRVFGRTKIACIGPGTSRCLSKFGIKADFVPSVYTGIELARELGMKVSLKGRRVLVLRSAMGSKVLVDELARYGAVIEEVSVYTVVAKKNDAKELAERLQRGDVDWVTFTSPSTVRVFFEQVGAELVKLNKVRVASIGPVTSAELAKAGVRADAEAQEHTTDGLLDAIEGFVKSVRTSS